MGAKVGVAVGASVGATVGAADGGAVGASVGNATGCVVGPLSILPEARNCEYAPRPSVWACEYPSLVVDSRMDSEGGLSPVDSAAPVPSLPLPWK